jgi:shikimate dehydrogenase
MALHSAPPSTSETLAAPRSLLCGLIGSGIQRSLTPAMQRAEAGAHGLSMHYQLIDLDLRGLDAAALPGLVQALRTIGFDGFNVTYPCKQAIIPLLDDVSDEARRMGAVNTVTHRAGRLIGHNTDGSGWVWGFLRQLPGADLSSVVLLGAGGAGSAIAHALLDLGVGTLSIVDADPSRALALAGSLEAIRGKAMIRSACDVGSVLSTATGLVHATPTGMDKLPGLPLDVSLLRPEQWVSEVVYFPLETELLRAARARGCRVADGGGMAVGQAVGAFELFTGLRAEASRMDAHFRRLVAAR